MNAKMFIILYLFNNKVQHGHSDLQISFQERNKVFAVVGEDPYTILQPYKAESAHNLTQAIANQPPLLRNIKNNHSPAIVPSSFLFQFHFLFFKSKLSTTRFGNTRILL